MHRFAIERSEVELESSFAPRLWALVHDAPVLYDALLDQLRPLGLSSTDLRPDAGDGSVGSAGLGFWLFDGKTNVRVGLESVRFRWAVSPFEIAGSVDGVTNALRQALPEFRFRTHAFSYACHGRVEGAKSAEFVRRFTPDGPGIEGFGERLGAGAAFYFGEAPPVISSTLTLDVSRALQDGLFVRVYMVVDETVDTGQGIQTVGEERIRAALRSVNLETG